MGAEYWLLVVMTMKTYGLDMKIRIEDVKMERVNGKVCKSFVHNALGDGMPKVMCISPKGDVYKNWVDSNDTKPKISN